MEQNTPMIAKKIWNIIRVAFYMLRKGICKRKILMDLNLVMKRGKIAGKALQNLMFHHKYNHHGSSAYSEVGLDGQFKPEGEFEFSCSNTPLYHHYFATNKRKNNHSKKLSIDDAKSIEAVNNMFDMMMLSNDEVVMGSSPLPSPSPARSRLGLGLGFSPAVRQLRVTDSPFPLVNGEDDKHVDVAADEFIKKFYSQLKQQKYH